KAHFLMQLTEAPDNEKLSRAQDALEALSNGFQSNEDNAEFPYVDDSNSRNPWSIIEKYPNLDNIQMSAHYIDLLKSLDDPRLEIQAQPAKKHTDNMKFRGFENGALESVSVDSISRIGLAYVGGDAPGRLLSYSAAKFLEAQATLITDGPDAANEPYLNAIRANMKQLNVPHSDISDYINEREDLSKVSNPLENIIVQKYIANFLNPQAWHDWRNTGY